MASLRTVVTFQSSAFNTTVIRPYFMTATSFGDDLAQHLAYALTARGYPASDPAQEDFGWYFRFQVRGKSHMFVLGRRPVEEDWLGSIERIPFLFFSRKIDPQAPAAIHGVLADESIFRNVRWHLAEEFDAGKEERGAFHP